MQKAPLPQATHGLREIRNIFTLASVIVLGTCLRLLHLGQKSYWWDEIVTVKLCRLPFSAFRAWVWKFEANMAFYLLVLRPWL